MPVHDAARGLDGTATAYERARPTYPPEALNTLVAALDIGPGGTVVDLAAGTGKLTRLLVPTGACLVAVEPLAGMRAELAQAVPGVESYEGVAEALPEPERSRLLERVRRLFDGMPSRFPVPYHTELWWCRLR